MKRIVNFMREHHWSPLAVFATLAGVSMSPHRSISYDFTYHISRDYSKKYLSMIQKIRIYGDIISILRNYAFLNLILEEELC